MNSKHNTYFELRDAVGAPGCVVCRLAARSVRRYLEALSFESVNDYGLRTQLRKARGFCNLHAWQLLDEVRDPFGAGIIYRDVLHDCAGRLGRGDQASLAPEAGCLACGAREESARRYVDVLVEHVDEALGGRLAAAGGLCWRHFALGVARGGRGIVALARAQRDAIERASGGAAPAARSGPRLPTPGVRAGNVAPRRAPDEDVGDPVVAISVGLRGVHGVAIDQLEARAWGAPDSGLSAAETTPESGAGTARDGAGASIESAAHNRRELASSGSVGAGDARAALGLHEVAARGGECAICRAGLAAAADAAGRLATEGARSLAESLDRASSPAAPRDAALGTPAHEAAIGGQAAELCAPHGWLAVELAGAAVARRSLLPALELLVERIGASTDDLARSRPLTIGSLAVATPGARRARGDLALRLAPGRGCVVCQAQLAAEEECLDAGIDGFVCRPHLLLHARHGGRIAVAPTLKRWQAVVTDLVEYIRKNDYRFRDEPRGDEQYSPWRAVALAAGARGVR